MKKLYLVVKFTCYCFNRLNITTLMKCCKLHNILYFILFFQIVSCDEFKIVRNRPKLSQYFDGIASWLYNHEISELFCIADSINDAIVWNTNLKWKSNQCAFTDRKNLQQVSRLSSDAEFDDTKRKCDIIVGSDVCELSIEYEALSWDSVHSSDLPMGPVFDSLWETFHEHNTFEWNSLTYKAVTINKNGYNTNLTLNGDGTVVVSVRGGANAHFLMCNRPDHNTSSCYWVIIGGWHNTESAIRKCVNGVTGKPPNEDECRKKRASTEHGKLSINEWKTFVITWNAHDHRIIVYDPVNAILDYTDDAEYIDAKYIFFGNSEQFLYQMQFRFHEYHYKFTSEAQSRFVIKQLDINTDGELCLDMIVGICDQCYLQVFLYDNQHKERITYSILPKIVETVKHGLPMWQHERISVKNLNKTHTPLELQIVTFSDRETRNFFAVRGIQQCPPKGSVKILEMTASQDYDPVTYWPKVLCQRLSYNKSHAGVIELKEVDKFKALNPPDNLTLCPENRFGPHCVMYCNTIDNPWNCRGKMICDSDNGCYCPQGYRPDNCEIACSNGKFGYGCRETCDNCLDKNCSFSTGICKAGCGKDDALQKYVPPHCKDMVGFPELIYDQRDSTTLRIYFTKFDQNKMFNVTYEFEIQVDQDTRPKQPAETGVENGTPIYFTTFHNLKEGMKYKARISENIEYKSSDKVEVIHLDGDFSKVSEMCIWTENFEIVPEDKNFTIKKNDNNNLFSCPDDWYSLKVFPKYSNPKDEPPIEVKGTFPRTVTGLTEDTEYVILVAGLTSSVQIRKELSTLPKKPLAVETFKIVDAKTTEASAKWSPPTDPNAKVDLYLMTVKPLSFQGCRISSPKNSMSSHTYSLGNTSNDYTMKNLIPYVNYKATISVFYKRQGIEKEDYFRTNSTEIPTAIYEDLSFDNNVIKWSYPLDNCSTISGPIRATRLFFRGESENVKDFIDQYDTDSESLKLDQMKGHTFYGAEKYLVKVHALREINGKHNENAYAELVFTTNPRPPPKVMNLTIFEVDSTQQIMSLKWKPPLPPTNGEIIKYRVIDTGSSWVKKYVFPNDTCPLWDGWICATIDHSSPITGTIEVSGKNKNTSKYGDPFTISDTFRETAPDPPGRVHVSRSNPGTIKLHWGHPFRTGGPMKEFSIHRKLQSTRLTRKLSAIDKDESVKFNFSTYQRIYTTQLNVLPSTHYKIDIHGVVITRKDRLMGNSSSTDVKTRSLFEWIKTEPSYIVDNSTHTIELSVPDIANYTHDGRIHVIIIGETLCPTIPILSDSLADDIRLQYGEIAWHFGMFPTPPVSVSIGNNTDDDKDIKCRLRVGNSYVIVVVVREDGVAESERAVPIVWRSKSIQIGPKPRIRHELWAVPLLSLIIMVVGLVFYLKKKRKRIENSQSKIVVDVPESVATLKEVERVWKRNYVKSPSPIPMKKRPDTVEFRESILLTPAVSLEKLKPTPIVEETYEKIKCTSLMKLNEFQDYVKRAIASGKLNEQYSLFPRGQMKSWDYGELPENKKKNRYGNLIAYDETRVILEKLPDDSHSDYINANYIKGYKKKRAYIATQGPKPTTIIDFWRMIWQEKVQVICMLANIMEGGKTKCEQYWPDIGKVMKYGNISVSNISHVQFADYTFRIFHIKLDQEVRKVDQLHYTAWPDHGIPLYTQSVVAYLKKLLATPSGNGPILVHCSAGVGRTGTIILCDICLRRAAAEGVVDVFGETDEIRKQRANMVDNKQQYILAHVALVECLLSFPTAIPCNDSLPTRIQEYKKQLPLQQQRLEQSAWQDEALQSSTRLQLKLTEKNIAKNRFPESLPFTRLFIPRYPITDDDSSYIHGVYVDSARHQNSFIATQLPLPKTVVDFWRMVAEFKVQLIIILQPPDTENPTCCKFVPEPDEDISPLVYLNLKGKSITDGEHAIQQKICLTDNSTKNPREQTITILTCKEWDPGRNKPPPKPEILVNLWQVAEKISRNDEPAVVICHDGVTGCGLYLAMSFLLERMGLEHECDVCFAVRAIRRSRSDFCQTREQFEYLYDTALIYNGFFETYANFT